MFSQITTMLTYTACSWKPLKIISKQEKEINHLNIIRIINSFQLSVNETS